MPLPSEADIQSAIGKALIIDKELYAALAVTGTHIVTREAAYLAAVPADAQPAAQAAQRRMRQALNASTLMIPDRLAPLLSTYARVRGLPVDRNVFDRLFHDLADRSKSVKSRAFSHGSWSAGGSNVGSGTIRRLTVDDRNFTIESGFAEAKTAECIADSNSGTERHRERFQVRGARPGYDNLERIGSGASVIVEALSSKSTQDRGVQNPSFENLATSGAFSATTDVQGWTMSDVAKFESEDADYYRDVPGASASRSLRFTGNATLKQTFAAMRFQWRERVPLYAQIAFKRESSCDGNLKLTIGGVTATVALVAQSGWTILTFPITTNAWFRQWNTVGADPATNGITIELESNTTGDLLVDDLIVSEYTPFDGAWVAIIGGATPFEVQDTFTATDTSSDTGIIQTQLAKGLGLYLPHVGGGAETWADPS